MQPGGLIRLRRSAFVDGPAAEPRVSSGTGVWPGTRADEAVGGGGFGYDPVFQPGGNVGELRRTDRRREERHQPPRPRVRGPHARRSGTIGALMRSDDAAGIRLGRGDKGDAARSRDVAPRAGLRRGDRLRRPRQRRREPDRRCPLRLPSRLGARGSQSDGRARAIPVGQTRARHGAQHARAPGRATDHAGSPGRSGGRPSSSRPPPTSPR